MRSWGDRGRVFVTLIICIIILAFAFSLPCIWDWAVRIEILRLRWKKMTRVEHRTGEGRPRSAEGAASIQVVRVSRRFRSVHVDSVCVTKDRCGLSDRDASCVVTDSSNAKFQSRASSGSGNVRQFSNVRQKSVCEGFGQSLWFGQHDSSGRAVTTKKFKITRGGRVVVSQKSRDFKRGRPTLDFPLSIWYYFLPICRRSPFSLFGGKAK